MATTLLELSSVVDDVWETGEDELVSVVLPRVDDLFKHSHDHLSSDVFTERSHRQELETNFSLSLVLVLDENVDIEVNKAMVVNEVLDHFLS
jgi:hypothetical protein